MPKVAVGFKSDEIQLITAGLPKSGFYIEILKNDSNKEIMLL